MKSEKRSGSYTTRVSLTDPTTGKRIQKRVTARTKRELDAKVAEVKSRWNRGDVFEPSKAKLSEYLERWLVAIAPSVRESTIERYRRTVKTHISPEIGHIPLAKVAPIHLQDLYTKKLGEGLAPNTVRGIHTVLHRAFDQAVKWDDIARNPASPVDVPMSPATETTTWTPDQAMTFLTATANDELGTFWLLALYTGMRRGELLALRWVDIDLELSLIHI